MPQDPATADEKTVGTGNGAGIYVWTVPSYAQGVEDAN